ncbi:MAG: penicillin-binding protein 2 [Campylobacterales bacterium]|nr:penicillin-binding protein 2 [Campylobacterales bacterium]
MRIKFLYYVILIVVCTLLIRIYYLSIKSNTYYDELAKRNTIKTQIIPPIRGQILDRYNRPLAVNKLGFSISIEPHLSRKSRREKLDSIIDIIVSNFKEFDKEKLRKIYLQNDSPYNHEYIPIIEFIPYDVMLPKYSMLNLNQDILIKPATNRFYPNNEIGSHVIGYVGKASQKENDENEISKYTQFVGKSGIEKFYNEFLQGELGYKKVKVTAFNEEIEVIEVNGTEVNNDISITLDLELQKFIHELFADKAGSLIVIDATDGSILASGSFPEINPNSFVSGISTEEWDELMNNPNHPFTNKFINGLYPPGSVIKMGVALSFLEFGGMNEYDTFFCNGKFEYGDRVFRCWKDEGHGSVNLVRAIRESCDDYFYKGSFKTGINNIAFTLRKLGLGKKTGVDLPNEFLGTIPDKEWKQKRYNRGWNVGETFNSAIGQGDTLTTPLQIALYTALIATGKQPIPHYLKSIYNIDVKFEPLDVLNKFEKSKLYLLRNGMTEVVNHERGTAHRHVKTKVKTAGKTGTAQVVAISQAEKKRIKESDMEYFHRSHAWLTTYFPADNPKYVVTALIEHGGHGGEATGGIVSSVINKMVNLGYVEVDDNQTNYK